MINKTEAQAERIYLVGPMGSGKSTIGSKLAKVINYDFIDLDQEIERSTGANISLIFELESESGFRKREAAALEKTLNMQKVIIATGGGVILIEENRKLLKDNGYNIYLTADATTIYKRVSHKKTRPLIDVDDPKNKIETILNERESLYKDVADCTIKTDNKNTKNIINEIMQKIKYQ